MPPQGTNHEQTTPLVNSPEPKRSKKVIAIIVIIGLGFIFLPKIFFTNVPSNLNWEGRSPVNFSISDHSIFKQYGYDHGFIERTGNTVEATPNVAGNLFTAPTVGILWSTQGNKIMTDLSKGYAVDSVMVFNKDLSFFRVMPLPKSTDACCTVSTAWLGDRFLLAHIFIPGVNPPGAGSYFYVGDTASTSPKVFEPLVLPDNLKRKNYLEIELTPHPNKNIVAISYCLTRVETWDYHYCSQYGFSIATPQRIEEVMTKNIGDTRNNFRIGWDDDNLYIQESDKSQVVETYSFSLSRYENDQFVSTLGESPDPTAKGEPVWLKAQVPMEQKSNQISFNIAFEATTTASRGFLTVFLDNEPIGVVYEEQEPKELHNKTIYFKEHNPGTYWLEFRLDPLNPVVKSSIKVDNVRFGFLDYGTD